MFVEHEAVQLSVLRSEFQLDQLYQNDGEKDARTGRRRQDRGNVKADDDEPGFHCLGKFFDCRIRLRRKARRYSKHPVEKNGQVQGKLTQEIAITTQRRVLKDGKKMQFWK